MNAPSYWRVMMSRMARFLKEGGCYYVQAQGRRYQKIFKMNSDYERYIQLLKKYKMQFRVSLHAYCLTPTTVRLIVYPQNTYTLPLFMQGINQSYALFFNRKYNGIGKVWEQRYKSTLINGDQELFACIKSIEFVPVQEKRSRSPVEYLWSSCTDRVLSSWGIIDAVSSGGINLDETIY